jgi:CTD kinase subunit gamma
VRKLPHSLGDIGFKLTIATFSNISIKNSRGIDMADPFEVRMRFTNLLHHLNASNTSALKCANYAIKYSEFSDDLHSCIIEQLERNNMNNRANIMYFLPALCDVAREKGEVSYGRMMERDILRIVDAVAPDDGSGAANVKVVRRVLKQLEGKSFLQPQTVLELEECIVGRDNGLGASPTHPASVQDSTLDPTGMPGTVRSTPHSTARDPFSSVPGMRLDKRQIEQRIEEDRERHKRAREGIWAIQQDSSSLRDDAELDRAWDEASRVDEDDWQIAKEEQEERRIALEHEEM